MSMNLFTTSCQGDALVAVAEGAIGSLGPVDARREADCLLAQMQAEGVKKLVIDLGKANYFGSHMIELMIITWRHLSPAHGILALCQVSETGREVLEAVGLDKFWPVCNTLDEALAAAAPCWESPR